MSVHEKPARCRTPTRLNVPLQSRPSPDGSSVDGSSAEEAEEKKIRPLSAVPGARRKRETPAPNKSSKHNTRRSPSSSRRPQSALVSTAASRRNKSDDSSDTTIKTPGVDVFNVTAVSKNGKIDRITRAPSIPDWSTSDEVAATPRSGMSSSEEKQIEAAFADTNEITFVDVLATDFSNEDEELNPAPASTTTANLDQDLAFCANFLPITTNSKYCGPTETAALKTEDEHLDRVRDWIADIQASDDEDGRWEGLVEAEPTDVSTSIKEEVSISGSNHNEPLCAAQTHVGTLVSEESFDDEDLDGIQELIDRCKSGDGFNSSKKDNLSDNYYNILETLELIDVKDGSAEPKFDSKEKSIASAAGSFASIRARSPAPSSAVPGKLAPYRFQGTSPSTGVELYGVASSTDVSEDIFRSSSQVTTATPTRSSAVASSIRDEFFHHDTPPPSVLEAGLEVGSKTGEIFALLDQHAGLSPISRTSAAKPSFNSHYAGDYIDALGKISVMELEVREKSNIIEDLKSTVAGQRELLATNAKNANRELRQKLEGQKKDYEETMKRHLNMIDQLIAEKRGLADRCEKLGEELKQLDKRHKDAVNSIEERHAAEVRRIRSVQSSAEKLKRDRWIDEKTKEIKELTVKGLEPEIQRLLERHKAELEGVRSGHKAELREGERRVKTEMTQEIERLKVEFQREKEAACTSEREIARHRLEKQFEEEEKLLQERRLKLLKQAEDEREKWERIVTKTRDEAHAQIQNQRQQFELELFQLRETLTNEEEKRVKDKEELAANLTKELEAEKSRLESNFQASVDQAIKARARDLEADREKQTDELRKEHLQEMEKLRSELSSEYESKLRRLKDKYTVEMEELENQEKTVHAKYFSVKSELTQVQEELIKYKTSSNQHEREMEAASKELNVLQEERKDKWVAIATQFESKIAGLEKDNRRMRLDLSECTDLLARERRGRENDRETLKKEKEDEMEQVFKRVKFALDKKEESMGQLKQEYQEVLLRNQQLQSLVKKQGSTSASSNRVRRFPSASKAPGKFS